MLKSLFAKIKLIFIRQKSNLLPHSSPPNQITTLDVRKKKTLLTKTRLQHTISSDCCWFAISFIPGKNSHIVNEYRPIKITQIPTLVSINNDRLQKLIEEQERKRGDLQRLLGNIKTYLHDQDSESAQKAMVTLLEASATFNEPSIKYDIEAIQRDLSELKRQEEKKRHLALQLIEKLQSDDNDSLIDSRDTEEEYLSFQLNADDYLKVSRENYEKWQEDQQRLPHVLYKVEDGKISNQDTNYYYNIKIPKYLCVVFPHRTRRTRRRGYCESFFEEKLKSAMLNIADVIGYASLALFDESRPYEPDIAIICKSSKNIRIDIEIDEPYTGFDHKPIHYIGCGDEFRDEHIVNAGWVVMRFAEKQVVLYADACISEIYRLIHHLDSTIPVPEKYQQFGLLYKTKRWTRLEALSMALRHERETLLNHEFSSMPDEEKDCGTIVRQRLAEKLASQQVNQLGTQILTKNIDNSFIQFNRDKDLFFYDKEHIYIYKNQYQLKSVSEVVDIFFEPFDEIYWSLRKSRDNNISQIKQLELWECKGNQSKEVGTFMHRQIQACFNGLPLDMFYNFEYNGSEYHYKVTIDITDELRYFMQFVKDYDIKPFRTEWSIYDLDLKIAGTIDLICRNDDAFDIFDWKRSIHININERIYGYGINGLYDVGDTRFNKYCLQINLYRYILEKNYGIRVNNMYLVVLHSAYSDYIVFDVPNMDEEVKIIVRHLTENDNERNSN